MGWNRSAAYSHLARLQDAGLITRVALPRGEGSLIVITDRGARQASPIVIGAPRSVAPSTWAHTVACAWVAAWLHVRGFAYFTTREVALDPYYAQEITYRDGAGQTRHATHRPDLITTAADGPVALEVELQRKSFARLRGILALYGGWCSANPDHTGLRGVVYVTANQDVTDVVTRVASEYDLEQAQVLRLRTYRDVISETRAARMPAADPQ